MKLSLRLLFLLFCFGSLPVLSPLAGEKTPPLSERTYKLLSRVHELMEERRYPEALARLDRMRARTEHKPYEHGLVLQSYGYIYARQEQYQQAIGAFTACLALKALPKPAVRSTLYTLAQLQVAVADHAAAVVSLERWFTLTEEPTPDAHALAGWVYAQTGGYAEAITHLNKALALAGNPQEQWYRQLLAVYYEAKRYPDAAKLLQQMVVRFPQCKDYWLQMSSLYRELGKDAQALAALEIAHDRGLLIEEADLLNLVHYYLYLGLPDKAGKLLARALSEGRVTPSAKQWRLLTDVWVRAREIERALAASEHALQVTEQAELRLKQAELLAIREQWPAVIEATERVISNPGFPGLGRAYLLQGIAHYQLQQTEQALVSFRSAAGFEKTRSQAEQWIRFISSIPRLVSRERTLYLSQHQL